MAWVVGAWLLCQASLAVLVPVSLSAQTAALEQTCTCSHNDGQMCPMHHTKSKSSQPACSCRSTDDGFTATLASLLGTTAVLAPASAVVATVGTTDVLTSLDTTLFDASFNPDPPPPRA